MDLGAQIFTGQRLRLAPINYDQDPEVEARWTQDARYLRLLDPAPARPLTSEQVKKNYEEIEKESDEKRSLYHFQVRTRPAEGEEERLIGFAQVRWIESHNGNGYVRLGIGDPNDWGKGYGTELLGMVLRYAFYELNLYRLGAIIAEYNLAALRLFQKYGFVEEVRRRKAYQRDGAFWDSLLLGLLQSEWLENQRTIQGKDNGSANS